MLKFAIRNLFSRPMRTLLSLLGLTVAIMGMVCLFSVAHGLDQQLDRTFGQIPGLAAMQPGAPIPLFSKLPASWGQEIRAVKGVSVVMSEVWQRINVINGKMILSPPRFWFGFDIKNSLKLDKDVYGKTIQQGRHLNLQDVGTRNCLISKQIAEEYLVGVDDELIINEFTHHIVGIYETGSLLLDVAVVLDIEQVRRMTGFPEDSVTSFYIEQKPGVDKAKLVERIKDVFRDRKLPVWTPSGLGLGIEPGGNPLKILATLFDRWLKSTDKPQPNPSPAKTVAPKENKTESPAQEPVEINPMLESGKRHAHRSPHGSGVGQAVRQIHPGSGHSSDGAYGHRRDHRGSQHCEYDADERQRTHHRTGDSQSQRLVEDGCAQADYV